MKKIITILMTLLLISMTALGCGIASKDDGSKGNGDQDKQPEAIDISIGGLKGPTSMGMVKLMEDSEGKSTSNNYSFTIAGSADEITPKLVQGELDIAAVPANLASVIYNNTKGAVKLLAVNTLGVVYIVETGETVQKVEDLKGKTIYATGKGAIPEYALRYILSSNGIDPDKDVTLEWKSEPTEVVSILSQTENAVAMLPQPYVTVAESSVENLRTAIDLTKAWDELKVGSKLITGVLVVRSQFAEEHPKQLAAFLDEYKDSTEYVNENVEEAAGLVEKYGIVKAAVAKKAIPYCNITYMEGMEMKSAIKGFLEVLYNQNPKSVGGNLPDDAFYYER